MLVVPSRVSSAHACSTRCSSEKLISPARMRNPRAHGEPDVPERVPLRTLAYRGRWARARPGRQSTRTSPATPRQRERPSHCERYRSRTTGGLLSARSPCWSEPGQPAQATWSRRRPIAEYDTPSCVCLSVSGTDPLRGSRITPPGWTRPARAHWVQPRSCSAKRVAGPGPSGTSSRRGTKVLAGGVGRAVGGRGVTRDRLPSGARERPWPENPPLSGPQIFVRKME
jgi:hypothetical protein